MNTLFPTETGKSFGIYAKNYATEWNLISQSKGVSSGYYDFVYDD